MTHKDAKDHTLLIIISLCLLLLALDYQKLLDQPKDLLLLLTSPIQAPFYQTRQRLSLLTAEIRSIPHQSRRIKELERRLSESSLRAQKAVELERELAAIKQHTKLKDGTTHRLLTAKVISLTRYALINRGASDGVKLGQAVLSADTMVGTIHSVLPHRSLVQLLKDQDTTLSVISSDGTTGKLTYTDNALTISEVLQKSPLTIEQPFYTKGTDLIPEGLLLGYINKIEEKPSSVYKTAHLDPASQITDESYVLIAAD